MGYFDRFPSTVFFFEVEIDGIGSIDCSSVGGLSAELDISELDEAASDGDVRGRPMGTKYSDITLTRGFVKNSSLMDWVKKFIFPVADHDFDTMDSEFKTMTITLNTQGNADPVMKWICENAYPSKISFSDLDASKSQIMFETLTIKYSKMTIEQPDIPMI